MEKMLSALKCMCLSLKRMLCSNSTATCKFTTKGKKKDLAVTKLWTVFEKDSRFLVDLIINLFIFYLFQIGF